eukprot:807532_1
MNTIGNIICINLENNGDIMWREIFDENGIMHQFEMSLDHKSLMSSSNGNILTKWNKINWNQKNLKIRNTNCSYKSHVENIMHACGHDCHMAILLTVARILSQPKYVNEITGVIKFIFQPGEECGCGAKYMISDGILNCPLVEQIILMSGSQSFEINIIGIGGHGAEPLNTSDTVLAITNLNIQLHSIISRNISPIDSGVITIGTCNIGSPGSYNII